MRVREGNDPNDAYFWYSSNDLNTGPEYISSSEHRPEFRHCLVT